MSEAFHLTNEEPKRTPWGTPESPKAKQTVMFSGMDCLPGQQDLFPTDGKDREATKG